MEMKEIVEKITAGHPLNRKGALLPILQEIQKESGFLTEDLVNEVGQLLNMPANKVYAVAAFYDQFRFSPLGRYHIRLCKGTSCHLFGATTYQAEIENQLKVRAGMTSRDRKFSLEIVNCLGACASSPVVKVNDTTYTRVTPDDLARILQSLKEKTA